MFLTLVRSTVSILENSGRHNTMAPTQLPSLQKQGHLPWDDTLTVSCDTLTVSPHENDLRSQTAGSSRLWAMAQNYGSVCKVWCVLHSGWCVLKTSSTAWSYQKSVGWGSCDTCSEYTKLNIGNVEPGLRGVERTHLVPPVTFKSSKFSKVSLWSTVSDTLTVSKITLLNEQFQTWHFHSVIDSEPQVWQWTRFRPKLTTRRNKGACSGTLTVLWQKGTWYIQELETLFVANMQKIHPITQICIWSKQNWWIKNWWHSYNTKFKKLVTLSGQNKLNKKRVTLHWPKRHIQKLVTLSHCMAFIVMRVFWNWVAGAIPFSNQCQGYLPTHPPTHPPHKTFQTRNFQSPRGHTYKWQRSSYNWSSLQA